MQTEKHGSTISENSNGSVTLVPIFGRQYPLRALRIRDLRYGLMIYASKMEFYIPATRQAMNCSSPGGV